MSLKLVYFSLLFSNVPSRAAAISRFVDGLGELVPDKWGLDGERKAAFDRNEFIQSLSLVEGWTNRVLSRTKKPKYEGSFDLSFEGGGIRSINLKFKQVNFGPELRRILELGHSLADQLRPEFACVGPMLEEHPDAYYRTSDLSANELEEFGPTPVSGRTWYGPKLLQMIGRSALSEAGLIVRDFTGGGVQVDLVADPSEEEACRQLLGRQSEAMKVLWKTGIYGNYETFPIIAGPKFHWSKEGITSHGGKVK